MERKHIDFPVEKMFRAQLLVKKLSEAWKGPLALISFKKKYRAIDLMSRVFANGPEDQGSIPGRVVPKTQKWYLIPPCLTQH